MLVEDVSRSPLSTACGLDRCNAVYFHHISVTKGVAGANRYPIVSAGGTEICLAFGPARILCSDLEPGEAVEQLSTNMAWMHRDGKSTG